MRFIYLVLILLFTSCGIEWQYTTLNHAAQVDAIYKSSDYRVNTFNYNFSQYTFDQPFIWGNPMFRNRYNFYNPYLGYNSYWNNWGWNSWYWNSWNRPYNYWNYYNPYFRRTNISYVNGYRNTTRTPSVSNRTRSATTISQVQNRTYTPTNRTIQTPTRSTTRSTTTRSVVRPSTTRSTTRSTSTRRINSNRKN